MSAEEGEVGDGNWDLEKCGGLKFVGDGNCGLEAGFGAVAGFNGLLGFRGRTGRAPAIGQPPDKDSQQSISMA